jgi:hypothetical protein
MLRGGKRPTRVQPARRSTEGEDFVPYRATKGQQPNIWAVAYLLLKKAEQLGVSVERGIVVRLEEVVRPTQSEVPRPANPRNDDNVSHQATGSEDPCRSAHRVMVAPERRIRP